MILSSHLGGEGDTIHLSPCYYPFISYHFSAEDCIVTMVDSEIPENWYASIQVMASNLHLDVEVGSHTGTNIVRNLTGNNSCKGGFLES